MKLFRWMHRKRRGPWDDAPPIKIVHFDVPVERLASVRDEPLWSELPLSFIKERLLWQIVASAKDRIEVRSERTNDEDGKQVIRYSTELYIGFGRVQRP